MSNFLQSVRSTVGSVLGSPDPRYEGTRRRVQRDPRIWRNRVASELEKLEGTPSSLPPGFSLAEKALDEDQGTCQLLFRLVTRSASDTHVTCDIAVDAGAALDFPFEPPGVRVASGADLFPPSTVAEDGSVQLVDWVPARHLGDVLTYLQELTDEARDAPWHRQASRALTRKGQHAIASIRSRKDKGGRAFREGEVLPAVDSAQFGRLFRCRPVGGAGVDNIASDLQAFVGVTIEQFVLLTAEGSEEIDLIRAASGEDPSTRFRVHLARQLKDLSRLRLREKTRLTLEFRHVSGGLSLSVAEAKLLVTALKEAMTRRGVKNRQTALQKHEQNRAQRRMGSTASQFLISIETAEQQLAHHPSIEAIQAVMDLFRQALEFFGSSACDEAQIMAVLEHKNRFLQRADVQLILQDHAPPERTAPATAKPQGHLVDSDDDEDPDGAERVGLSAVADDADEDEPVRTIVGAYAELDISPAGQVLVSPDAAYDSDDDLAREEGLVGLGGAGEGQGLGPGLRELRDMIGKVNDDDGTAGLPDEPVSHEGDDFLSFISTLQESADAGGGDAKAGSGSIVDEFDIDAVFAELDQLTAPQGDAKADA